MPEVKQEELSLEMVCENC